MHTRCSVLSLSLSLSRLVILSSSVPHAHMHTYSSVPHPSFSLNLHVRVCKQVSSLFIKTLIIELKVCLLINYVTLQVSMWLFYMNQLLTDVSNFLRIHSNYLMMVNLYRFTQRILFMHTLSPINILHIHALITLYIFFFSLFFLPIFSLPLSLSQVLSLKRWWRRWGRILRPRPL